MRLLTVLAAASALALLAPAAGRAQTLTDLVLFRTDAGGASIAEGWNTRGGDFVSNLYLRAPGGGAFVNSGNGANAGVALDLSAPGDYAFDFFAENAIGAAGVTTLGLNLFFNDVAATPRISAFGSQGGGFSANSASTSAPNFAAVPGAGTLAWTTGAVQVSLIGFSFQTAASTTNLVSQYDNVPGGGNDVAGTLTLRVAPAGAATVPEPGTLALFAPPLLVGALAVGRRRAASRPAA